jgi:uncharacterized protein (DUF2147 family)
MRHLPVTRTALSAPLALVVLAGAVLLPALAPPPAAAADSPGDALLGMWLTEAGDKGGRARVEISRQGDGYSGRIVWLEEPDFAAGEKRAGQPKVDLENPDAKLQERPILGLEILHGFTFSGDGEWGGGTIYDPANGKTYKARIRLETADTLDVRGYVGITLFGRTTTWKRVK